MLSTILNILISLTESVLFGMDLAQKTLDNQKIVIIMIQSHLPMAEGVLSPSE
jgi:hypothetical protein